MGRLEGKVAIVTGAGGGIGRQHALQLANEGASVLVNDIGIRAGADAAGVAAEIVDSGGVAIANTISATWDGANEIIGAAIDVFGKIDILINNATAARMNDLWRITEEDWDLAHDVNLKGYFAMIRSAAPHFCRQASGAIVNTSSGAGLGAPSHIAYASAKEGVVGLTRTVARELGRFGVRCNAIRPLAVGESTKDYVASTTRWTRLQQLTTGPTPGKIHHALTSVYDPVALGPHKVSPFVVWLCTDSASNVNGRTFNVGGDVITRLSEPQPERTVYRAGGWDLETLDDAAPDYLVQDLTNGYSLDDYPELKVFEE
jgi:3-oxoacyl-[acyl-carrier protein] reductase